VGLFDFLKRNKNNNSDEFKNSTEAKRLIEQIDKHNKELETVTEEYFDGEGKPYQYLFKDGTKRAEGFYYYLGYDKRGEIVDEKYQGKNIEYFENGVIKEIVFYKDGVPTGENYIFDINGNAAKRT
jgi:antitoxin component YwqK of YwqJK toxin-antitoxin module